MRAQKSKFDVAGNYCATHTHEKVMKLPHSIPVTEC